MAELFRIDPEALADAVEQMADFQRFRRTCSVKSSRW